jgi:hypothetical protein
LIGSISFIIYFTLLETCSQSVLSTIVNTKDTFRITNIVFEPSCSLNSLLYQSLQNQSIRSLESVIYNLFLGIPPAGKFPTHFTYDLTSNIHIMKTNEIL